MRTNELLDMKLQEEETSIHGDLLEAVFANVPLIDLANACRVSKSWDTAVSSSLTHLKKVKPWLIIQTQGVGSMANKTMHGYDPRSNTWIEINPLSSPTKHNSPIHSSSSTFLYELSPTHLSYSLDPLHKKWHHISPPHVSRMDPIVDTVRSHIIVVGGASFFEDDPLSVEMYDMETGHWSTCQSIPYILKDSAASTWLSVATNQNTLYVTEKASGITYSFSPQTKSWSGPYNLRPDPSVFFSAIGFAGNDLILAGLVGHAENVQTIKLWKVDTELTEMDEISEIPYELLEKLKGEDMSVYSISLLVTDDFIYMYKNACPGEIIFCEYVQGEGEWKWASVKNMALNDATRINQRMVMSCSKVGIADLHMAMKSGNCKFVVK